MNERIKVQNKTGNLGTNVVIERSKSKVSVTADIQFSKRYALLSSDFSESSVSVSNWKKKMLGFEISR